MKGRILANVGATSLWINQPDQKPKGKNSEIASAEEQVKLSASSLLRYSPTGDSTPPLRLKALVWSKGSLLARPHGPNPHFLS